VSRFLGRRHLASFLVLAAFLGLNTATSKSPGGYSGPTPPPPVIDAGFAKSAGDAAPPKVLDLDTAAVTKSQCAGKSGDMCRILGEFSKGSTPKDLPATGQDVWAGWTYGGGRLPYFLKIQRGYTPSPNPALDDEVMEVSGALQSVPPANAPEADVSAWIASAKDGKPTPIGNRAGEFAHTYSPPDWFAMARATSGSIALLTDKSAPHIFVRASGTRLLVALYDGGKTLKIGKSEAPLWCAELWKVK